MTFEGKAGDPVLVRFKDGSEMRRVLDADADFEIRAIHVKSDHIDGYWWVPKGELESVTVIREPKPGEYWVFRGGAFEGNSPLRFEITDQLRTRTDGSGH